MRIELGVARFAAIIKFFAHTRTNLNRDFARVDGRIEPAMQRKEHVELIEISFNS